jgi:hypothetical protein
LERWCINNGNNRWERGWQVVSNWLTKWTILWLSLNVVRVDLIIKLYKDEFI